MRSILNFIKEAEKAEAGSGHYTLEEKIHSPLTRPAQYLDANYPAKVST
jgi:hypothetical protein